MQGFLYQGKADLVECSVQVATVALIPSIACSVSDKNGELRNFTCPILWHIAYQKDIQRILLLGYCLLFKKYPAGASASWSILQGKAKTQFVLPIFLFLGQIIEPRQEKHVLSRHVLSHSTWDFYFIVFEPSSTLKYCYVCIGSIKLSPLPLAYCNLVSCTMVYVWSTQDICDDMNYLTIPWISLHRPQYVWDVFTPQICQVLVRGAYYFRQYSKVISMWIRYVGLIPTLLCQFAPACTQPASCFHHMLKPIAALCIA